MVTCGIAALLPNPCLDRVRCDSGEIGNSTHNNKPEIS